MLMCDSISQTRQYQLFKQTVSRESRRIAGGFWEVWGVEVEEMLAVRGSGEGLGGDQGSRMDC